MVVKKIPPPKGKSGEWHLIDCRPDGYTGKRVRVKFNVPLDVALELEKELMLSGQPKPESLLSPKIIDLFTPWLAYYRTAVQPSTYRDAVNTFARLLAFFGQHRANQLTKTFIEEYKGERLRDGVKKRTINKELSYFSSLIKWATEFDKIKPLSFAIKFFPRRQTVAPIPRPLTPEQVTDVLEQIEPHYRLIYLLMSDGGLRISEAVAMQAENVDLARGLLFVRGKGDKERIVPITSERLREALEQGPVKGYLTINPVTKRPYREIKKALARAAQKAGITRRVNQHLLRHSFGTIATVSGLDLTALQNIMGHSSAKTTAIYQHVAADYLKSEGLKFRVHTGQNDVREKTDNQEDATGPV